MKNPSYFHVLRVCPSCNKLIEDTDCHDKVVICPNCQVRFEYTNLKCNADAYQKYISTIKNAQSCIPWPIILNDIEREYSDFIVDSPQHAYFVTWPWDKVKTIPLMAFEYVSKHPDSRILIVDRHIFDGEIWSYDRTDSQQVDGGVKTCIVKSKLKSQIIKKQLASHYTIKYPQRSSFSGTFPGSITKVKKKLEEEYLGKDEEWGPSEEINIKGAKKECSGGRGPKLKIEEVESYMLDSLQCDIVSIQHIISNSDSIVSIANRNAYCHTDEFVKLVNNSIPLDFELILIPDGDHMMASVSNKIDRLLSEKRVFIFSLNKDTRYQYGLINSNNIIASQNIVPHTIDCLPVLEKCAIKESGNNSIFSTKLNSKIILSESPPQIIEGVTELEKIQDVFVLLSSISNDTKLNRFLRWVQRTPLDVKDESRKSTVFKIMIPDRENTSFDTIDYEEFIRRIEDLNPDVSKKIHSIMEEIYGTYLDSKSPLFDVAVERVDQETSKGNNVFLIVHRTASKGTKGKLQSRGRKDIKVETWETIQNALHNYTNSKNIIVSLSPPFPWNSLKLNNIQKIIHLCSPIDVEIVQAIFERRFNEYLRRPCYRIESDGPTFLIDSLKDEKMPPTQVCDDILFDYESRTYHTESTGHKAGNNILLKGSSAILLQHGTRGVFIAPRSSLFLRSDSKIEFLKINPHDRLSNLEDKSVLIDKQRMYRRFRVVINEFLINKVKSKLNHGPYEWENYLELMLDSQYWIELFDNAIENYSNTMDNENDTDNIIIEEISKSKVVAKDKNTISNWRRRKEVIDTDMGVIKIFNTETPKGVEDIDIICDILSKYTTVDSNRVKSCKVAIEYVRKIRHGILQNQRLPIQIRKLMGDINNVLETLFAGSDTFYITGAKEVIMSKDVEEMTIISDLMDYCEL